MTHDPTPFGDAQDPVVGAALRAHLDEGARDDLLLARISAAVRRAPAPDGFDVLSGWLAPGLAAAAALLLAAMLWTRLLQPAPMEAALGPSGESLMAAAIGTPEAR